MNIEERLQQLENECFNNKLRRQLEAHYTGQIISYLVSALPIDGDQLKQAIIQMGEDTKKRSNYAPDSVRIIEEHISKWLWHIQSDEPKEFVFQSGGIS